MNDHPFNHIYLDPNWKPREPGPCVEYQPKGGMCMTCKHNERDCSALRFQAMPIIEQTATVNVVRCTEYARAAK